MNPHPTHAFAAMLLSVRYANCPQLAASCVQALTSRSHGMRTAITGTVFLH